MMPVCNTRLTSNDTNPNCRNRPGSGTTMDDMPTTPAHAKPRAEGLIAAWLCLVIAGAATVTFNIVHAWRSGMASPLGCVEGVVPVALAMIVSHLVATSSAGRLLRGITFAVMIGALALSVRATGAVVAPAAGPLWWLYGAVVDAAALVSLQLLLTLKARAAERERERVAQEAAAADERTALRAGLDALTETLETAQAEHASSQHELAGALTEAQRRESEALARVEVLERKLAAKSAQKPRQRKRETAQSEDLTTELRALKFLDDEPALRQPGMGGELARKLGVSPATGRRWHARLTAQAVPPESLSERSPERPDERSGERS